MLAIIWPLLVLAEDETIVSDTANVAAASEDVAAATKNENAAQKVSDNADENTSENVPAARSFTRIQPPADYVYVPEDTDLIFETEVQGYLQEDYTYAYNDKGKVYIPLSQLAAFVGIMYEKNNNIINAYYSNKKDAVYVIDLNTMTASAGKPVEMSPSDYKFIDKTMFFSTDFLNRLFGMEISYDFYDMVLKIDREQEFPSMVRRNADARRKKSRKYEFTDKSFKGYEFDERWFSTPVIDLTLGKSWGHAPKGRISNSDNYSLNVSAIMGGLDVNSYISGSSSDNRKPQVRLYGGRTLLDEPPNKLNLKQFRIGDINGVNDTYFAASSYGRGITASSFKDLVMSADKTVDIVGPLREGWEVELYWNDQLIGFRQNAVAGEYNFPNIPVSYGLNTFKLVFYGPYGETYTEEKRYYSGTSPVKQGEIGYNVAAYQPWRYLFENNEQRGYDGKDIPVLDTAFYYGLSNNATMIGGLTQTPDGNMNDTTQHFSMLGIQYAMSGSSMQYNLESNLDTGKFGHHMEWQGDVYIGSISAMYDRYNKLHSPLSYYGGDYMRDKLELRYSGNAFSIPYYVSYRTGITENGDKPYESVVSRVSKSLASNWYFSAEDTYDKIAKTNELTPSIYTYWDNYTLDNNITYRSQPDPAFTYFSSKLTWRQDRYTYYTASYRRDLKSRMDYYSVTGSRVFDFGGLSLSLSIDKRGNFSTTLNYNISFSKEPDHFNILTSANSKLSNSGSIYAFLHDDDGNPLEGVGVTATHAVNEQYTDEDGTVFITDLTANDKTIFNIDMETLDDVSLKPDSDVKKYVLRPGALKVVDIEFKHYATVEGQIANPYAKRLYGYKVAAVDSQGKELASVFSDLEGYFIISDVPYGVVNLVVSKDGNELTTIPDVKVDDIDIFIEQEVEIAEAMSPPENYYEDDDEEETAGDLSEVEDEVPDDVSHLEDYAIDDESKSGQESADAEESGQESADAEESGQESVADRDSGQDEASDTKEQLDAIKENSPTVSSDEENTELLPTAQDMLSADSHLAAPPKYMPQAVATETPATGDLPSKESPLDAQTPDKVIKVNDENDNSSAQEQ